MKTLLSIILIILAIILGFIFIDNDTEKSLEQYNDIDSALKLYDDGEYKKSLSIFQQPKFKDNQQAVFLSAIQYYYGIGTSEDEEKAYKYFKKSYELGEVDSLPYLMKLCGKVTCDEDGKAKLEKNSKKFNDSQQYWAEQLMQTETAEGYSLQATSKLKANSLDELVASANTSKHHNEALVLLKKAIELNNIETTVGVFTAMNVIITEKILSHSKPNFRKYTTTEEFNSTLALLDEGYDKALECGINEGNYRKIFRKCPIGAVEKFGSSCINKDNLKQSYAFNSVLVILGRTAISGVIMALESTANIESDLEKYGEKVTEMFKAAHGKRLKDTIERFNLAKLYMANVSDYEKEKLSKEIEGITDSVLFILNEVYTEDEVAQILEKANANAKAEFLEKTSSGFCAKYFVE